MPLQLVQLLVLHASLQTQPVVTQFLVGETMLGENSTTRTGDSFVSETHLTDLIKLDSKLTGKFSKGRLIEFKLEEKDEKNSGVIALKDGKLNVVTNGKEVVKDKPYTQKGFAMLSNWHPILWETYLAAIDDSKGKPFSVTLINGLVEFQTSARSETIPLNTPEGKKPVTIVTSDISGITTKMAFIDKKVIGLTVPAQKALFIRKGYDDIFADPLKAYPELSQPTEKTKTDTSLVTPMRDGVNLRGSMTLPEKEGKYPCILIRTPYGREASLSQEGDFYAKRGYVVLSQDVRGRGDSDGEFDPFNTEVADGKDTLDWIEKQPWSNGKVGMIGGSYLGSVQWSAAVTGHPALKCIIPQVSPPQPTKNLPFDNGEFMLASSLWWSRIVADKKADMTQISATLASPKAFTTLPITKIDNEVLKRNIPFFDTWVTRDTMDKWPGAFSTEQVSKVKIPVMHVSGYWDGDGIGTKLHYEALAKNGGNQWLVFGPWEHFFNVKTKFQNIDYGSNSVLELNSVYLRFFDTYLKDKQVKMDEQPRVRFFIAGANKWVTGPSWPLPSMTQKTYFLGGGKANGGKSLGTLINTAGKADQDFYVYDPAKLGQSTQEIQPMQTGRDLDARPSDFKDGQLVYRTEAFKTPMTFAGSLTANLFISTTAKDVSFHAMVMDEGTDGKRRPLGMAGNLKVSYMNEKFEPLTPKKVYNIKIEPWWFGNEFGVGHRLVFVVFSDVFPGMARNPGTGERLADATKLLSATETVYKGSKYPSKITVWQLPNP